MSKNILVITGSPRIGGNSDLLADAYIKGAKSAGHTVTKFETGLKKIGPCKACDTCWSKGTPCSFDDDFTQLCSLLEAADRVVFVSPLYWFGLSAQIKLAIDRLYAYCSENAKRKLKIKQASLIVCGADTDAKIFKGAVKTYKNICRYLNWKNKGVLIVPGVSAKGDVVKTDGLALTESMGKGEKI